MMALVLTERLVVIGKSAAAPDPAKISSMVVSISNDTLLFDESLGLTFRVIPMSSRE